jgi:hypothetical protein
MGTTRILSIQIVGVQAVPVTPPLHTNRVKPVISVDDKGETAIPVGL